MLNPFPELFFLTVLAPTLLRIAAGIVFFTLATEHWRDRTSVRDALPSFLGKARKAYPTALVGIEALVGAALIAGFFTQIAAFVGLLGIVKGLALRKRFPAIFTLSPVAYWLLGTILLTLLITGAGAFAFDLPL